MSHAATSRHDASSRPAGSGAAAKFDYAEPAELFTRRDAAAQKASAAVRLARECS